MFIKRKNLRSLPIVQVMESLREQREVNGKLREYVDRILLLAIEKNPSILEIEHSKSNP